MQERLSYDVIILGGGGAALRAALAAREADPQARVLLVTKGELGKSGVTATACSDRMAFHVTLPFTEPGGPDNWRYHAEDIYKFGGYVSDPVLAEVLAKSSARAFAYLDGLGVPFVKGADGRPRQFLTDGSVYARACYTGPHTANHIEEALVRRVREVEGIEILERHMAFRLETDAEGAVSGVWVIPEEVEAGKAVPLFLAAPAVVLATGGAGEVFAFNVYPPGATGDGYALALEAGATLVNMEFIQIGLCSVATKLACSGSLMRALPRFVNDLGEEFLYRGWPGRPQELAELVFAKGASWPVAYEHPSHFLDVMVAREILKGRRVYLDYGANPWGVVWTELSPALLARYAREQKADLGEEARAASPLARLREINPEVIAWLAARGLDLSAGARIEIQPAIQHFQGGVWINAKAETTVPGLYAAGEVAGGQHGANRPGGNALLDGQVFGEIAGREAAERAAAAREGKARGGGGGYNRSEAKRGEERDLPSFTSWPVMSASEAPVGEKGGEAGALTPLSASLIRPALQNLMSQAAGVIRTAEGLAAALAQVRAWQKAGVAVDEHGPAYALETRNMLQVAEAVLRAAAARPESKGPHLFFAAERGEPLPAGEKGKTAIMLTATEIWTHSFAREEEHAVASGG